MFYLTAIRELEWQKKLFQHQMARIVILCVAALGCWLGTIIFPNFFNYPYFKWGGWGAVVQFWPALLWAAIMATLSGIRSVPVHVSERSALLRYGLTTSVLAGVWEELGYRWIFIFYAMLVLAVINWLFGAGLAWVMVTISVIVTGALIYEKEWFPAILGTVAVVLAVVFVQYADPVYWLYQLLVWVIHYTTFFQMDSVLYNGHDQLFLFGAILANSWFRDGHKYQGPVGIINSWYMGMVLLYATMTYGLVTAIVIHILYDIEFDVIRYVLRQTK